MERDEVTLLEFRMACVKSCVLRHIVQSAADRVLADGDVLLQICYGLTEEIYVRRYVCIYQRTQ